MPPLGSLPTCGSSTLSPSHLLGIQALSLVKVPSLILGLLALPPLRLSAYWAFPQGSLLLAYSLGSLLH